LDNNFVKKNEEKNENFIYNESPEQNLHSRDKKKKTDDSFSYHRKEYDINNEPMSVRSEKTSYDGQEK
jgi:hypothetical protein